MQCINATYDGKSRSEPWWQGFMKDFMEKFPSTALDQCFTSKDRYQESVILLREVSMLHLQSLRGLMSMAAIGKVDGCPQRKDCQGLQC